MNFILVQTILYLFILKKDSNAFIIKSRTCFAFRFWNHVNPRFMVLHHTSFYKIIILREIRKNTLKNRHMDVNKLGMTSLNTQKI